MGKRGFGLIKFLLDAADMVIIYLALVLSYQVRFHSGLFDVTKGVPPFERYQQSFLAISILLFLLFWAEGIYDLRGRFTLEQFVQVIKTLALASICLLALAFFIRDFEYSRLTIGLGITLVTGLIGLSHTLKRRIVRALHRTGMGVARVLIVGSGNLARTCFENIAGNPDLGIEVLGRLSDGEPIDPIEGCPELGSLERLPDLINERDVSEVFITLEEYSPRRVMEIIGQAQAGRVTFRVIPDVYSIIASSVHIGNVAGLPVIDIGLLPIHGVQGQIKHGVDFVFSLLGLIVTSPLLLLIALLIKLESPGPVIYSQKRVGLDGQPFTIYKFRSMRIDAEAETGPIWANPDDPRKTRVGSFIRKWSLDELPQLLNVLKGEMSLVGPRPERPHFVDQFRERIPDYMHRHRVKTGITGWAQINGLRGQSPIEDRTRYDIWYIENWSLLLDFEIILKTVWVCLFNPTGY